MSNDVELPRPVRAALNQIAHARGQLHAITQKERLRREIEALLAEGLSAEEALERLRCNPPVVDPKY